MRKDKKLTLYTALSVDYHFYINRECPIGTGLVYMNTRYYDPAIRRFINADNYMLLGLLAGQRGGVNMYAYALNDPINHVDPSGQLAVSGFLVAVVIGAIKGNLYLGFR